MSLPVLIRFPHLQERGIVSNWPQLGRLIRDHEFPPGILIGPNTRAWREDQIEDWLANRPIASKPDPRKNDEAVTAEYSTGEIRRGDNDEVSPDPQKRTARKKYPIDNPTEPLS